MPQIGPPPRSLSSLMRPDQLLMKSAFRWSSLCLKGMIVEKNSSSFVLLCSQIVSPGNSHMDRITKKKGLGTRGSVAWGTWLVPAPVASLQLLRPTRPTPAWSSALVLHFFGSCFPSRAQRTPPPHLHISAAVSSSH